jgi:hypothetical protein
MTVERKTAEFGKCSGHAEFVKLHSQYTEFVTAIDTFRTKCHCLAGDYDHAAWRGESCQGVLMSVLRSTYGGMIAV